MNAMGLVESIDTDCERHRFRAVAAVLLHTFPIGLLLRAGRACFTMLACVAIRYCGNVRVGVRTLH